MVILKVLFGIEFKIIWILIILNQNLFMIINNLKMLNRMINNYQKFHNRILKINQIIYKEEHLNNLNNQIKIIKNKNHKLEKNNKHKIVHNKKTVKNNMKLQLQIQQLNNSKNIMMIYINKLKENKKNMKFKKFNS